MRRRSPPNFAGSERRGQVLPPPLLDKFHRPAGDLQLLGIGLVPGQRRPGRNGWMPHSGVPQCCRNWDENPDSYNTYRPNPDYRYGSFHKRKESKWKEVSGPSRFCSTQKPSLNLYREELLERLTSLVKWPTNPLLLLLNRNEKTLMTFLSASNFPG